MINPTKLHQELVQAGIPIDGVDDSNPPTISFRAEATDKQKEMALKIVAAHVPEDYLDKRKTAYLQEGITPDAMIAALWERVVENHPEASNALQEQREAIKAKFPKDHP
jgi:hypothetical protein